MDSKNSTRAKRFTRWCKAGLLGAALALVGTQTNAQVSTNGGSGLALSYPDLAAAITALNGVGTASSPTVITVDPANPQTAPAGGYSITATGDAVNTITIDGGANTITAFAPQATGTLHDAIFEIIGGDYITIQNCVMLENPVNIITAAATNDMTEFGVAVFYATTTDGAQNVTIQNNTIDLNRTYQNTFGIYATSQHTATVLGAAQATAPTGAHNNLRIYSNQITDVNTGICVNGATTFANYAQGLDIGGTVGPVGNLGNTITNFGTTGTFSAYTGVSGTVNGIQITNQLNANVSWNVITSSAGGVTTTSTLRGIYYRQSAAPTSGAWTSNINDNSISLTHGAAGGAILAIADETGSAFNTLNIVNNDFYASGWTVPATAAYTAINNTVAEQNINIDSNGFFSLSLNTAGNVSLINNNLTRPAGASSICNNNQIVGGFTKTLGGGTVFCYDSFGISSNTGTEVVTNNIFSDGSVTGATTLRIMRVSDGSGTAPIRTCTNNTISNWVGGTGTITCLTSSFGLAANTNLVANNTISNISGGGTVVGLESTSGTQIFRNNTITGLSSTGASAVSGINISGGTTQTVERNKVCNLEGTNTSSTVNGIVSSAGTTNNFRNNTIGDVRAPNANTANPVNGINITGGITANVDYNTVYLSASSVGALFGTSALSVSTALALTLRNNILVNNSTPSGAGVIVAYRRSSTTLTSYQAASDRNIFYAGVPGPQNLIFSDGTNNLQDFALNYQPFVAARDANSYTENPTFASTSCGASDFLHFAPATSTLAESTGANITGITNDYDDNVRQGNPGYLGTGSGPDIGADEFEGINPLACVGAPTAGTIGGTTPICAGTGTTLSLSGHSTGLGIIYQWRMGTTSGGPYGTTLGTATTQATGVMAAGTYYYVVDVTCTSPGGSTVQTAEFTLVVDPTPTASATSNSPVCEGDALNLDGNGGIGTTYSWTGPGYGGGSNEDESIGSAALANNGTFVFTSTLGLCTSAPVNVSVVVNPNPTGVTANASDLTVCDGDLVDLTSGPSTPPGTILTENFNGVAAGWTTLNSTTGGATPALTAWTLRPNGFVPGGTAPLGGAHNSNDASQFYMSNSDAGGSGNNTLTFLNAPSISTVGYSSVSLSFWHFYRNLSATNDTARVQVSTDGGTNWTSVQFWNTTQGTATAWVNPTINLNAYVGVPDLRIRFRYRGVWAWWWSIDNVSVTGTPLPYAYGWTSSPAYFTSGVQNPTGVTVSPVPTTFEVTVTNTATGCFSTADVTVNPDLTDTDGDLIVDCDDDCPSLPGEQGDACDDSNANTVLDVINGSCVCAGTACTTDLELEFQMDGSSTVGWELRQQGSDILVQSGSVFLPSPGSFTQSTCLPDGCFYLVVTDDLGDGITSNGVQGGYILRTVTPANKRIIDNRNNFLNDYTSAIVNDGGFCLPLGNDRLISASCDRLDLQRGLTAACSEKLTADNTPNNTSGNVYQFWVYNPNGLESQLIPATGAGSNILAMNQVTLPAGKLYNVRVRTRISPGVWRPWGAACRMSISTTATPCRLTSLVDEAGPNLSCGKTVTLPAIGGGNGAANMLVARPVTRLNANCVSVGANKYQFRFTDVDDNSVIVIGGVGSNYYCYMTQPTFAPCKEYEVEVRASFDGGTTWCNYSTVCTVFTGGCDNELAGGLHMGATNQGVQLYPNPNRGDQLYLSLENVAAEVGTVNVDIYDAFGKRVSARTIAVNAGFVNTVVELNGELASGLYTVNITAGELTYTERLIIQP